MRPPDELDIIINERGEEEDRRRFILRLLRQNQLGDGGKVPRAPVSDDAFEGGGDADGE